MPQDKRALLKQRLENGEMNLHPLTFPQRELWEASPVSAADIANHICCFIEVRGAITAKACEAAIQRVVERQEALRISFLPGKDWPLQMIRKNSPASFCSRELSSAQRTPEAVEELAREIFREPFDLVHGPLYRVELFSRAADDHVLAFAIHHAIADGWTLGVFVQDLVMAYLQGMRGGREALPPVPLSYTAWGAAERAFWQPPELTRRAAFWKRNLAGSERLWPDLQPPKTASGAHRRMISCIPAELADATRELARRNGATLFSTLLTAFQIALSERMGGEDIVVGTPVANRSKGATRETMGYFAGIVPLRAKVDRNRPFAASLRAVHETTVNAFANAMPFVELLQALADAPFPGHNPVFDVRFALQNHPIPDVTLPGLSAKLRMRSTGTARFHLACEITEDGERLEVVWLFHPNLFTPQEIEDLGRTFEEVLAGAARQAESRTVALKT
jgi:hypothetical protein